MSFHYEDLTLKYFFKNNSCEIIKIALKDGNIITLKVTHEFSGKLRQTISFKIELQRKNIAHNLLSIDNCLLFNSKIEPKIFCNKTLPLIMNSVAKIKKTTVGFILIKEVLSIIRVKVAHKTNMIFETMESVDNF